jgi:hypothetical protein
MNRSSWHRYPSRIIEPGPSYQPTQVPVLKSKQKVMFPKRKLDSLARPLAFTSKKTIHTCSITSGHSDPFMSELSRLQVIPDPHPLPEVVGFVVFGEGRSDDSRHRLRSHG